MLYFSLLHPEVHDLLCYPQLWACWNHLSSQLTWKGCITAQWDHQEHAEVDSEWILGCSLLPFSQFPLSDRLPFMTILYLFPLFKGLLSKLHQSILYFMICWQIQTTPLDYWETVYWRKQATMLVRCYQVKNTLWQTSTNNLMIISTSLIGTYKRLTALQYLVQRILLKKNNKKKTTGKTSATLSPSEQLLTTESVFLPAVQPLDTISSELANTQHLGLLTHCFKLSICSRNDSPVISVSKNMSSLWLESVEQC